MNRLLILLSFLLTGSAIWSQTLTVDGAGRVGVLDNSPQYTLTVLHGNGTPAAGGGNGIELQNTNGGASWVLYSSATSSDLLLYQNGIQEVTFDNDGGINTLSDKRAKTNIALLASGQLAKIMQLKPSSYRYINSKTGKTTAGFLAQDVYHIFPEAVRHYASDDDGKETWMMSYQTLIPFVVKAMQEQQQIIDQQRSEIELLKKNQEALMKRLEILENR